MKRCLACATAFAGDTWTCPNCGGAPREHDAGALAFTEAPESGDFESSFFDELMEVEDLSFWFRTRNKLLVWALSRYFPGAQSFLEVGCGNGFVLRGLQRANPSLTLVGAELFPEGLRVARLRLSNIELLQADARALPYEREFDVVGAFDVLEHLDEDGLVLDQMQAAVKPGGGVMVTVPQHPFLWSAADDYAHHKRRYTRRELVAKVQRSGLEIAHVTSFISLLLPLLAASRLRNRSLSQGYDPLAEMRRSQRLAGVLEGIVDVELVLTRRGVSWPAGGTLLVVARRPNASMT